MIEGGAHECEEASVRITGSGAEELAALDTVRVDVVDVDEE